MGYEFTVYKGLDEEFHWRFSAPNKQIMADSAEGYKSRSACLHGIEVLQREAPTAKINDTTKKKVSQPT